MDYIGAYDKYAVSQKEKAPIAYNVYIFGINIKKII